MEYSKIDGVLKEGPIKEIRFIGEPIETNIFSSEGEMYFVWALKKLITIRCSTDIYFEDIETNELYIRESALKRDDWEGSIEGGFYIPGWVADYSKKMGVGIYQQVTIMNWLRNKPEFNSRLREKRGAKRKQFIVDRNKEILNKIRSRKGF